jgi:acetoin utilization deacetylase AcuC-like enzyme
MNRTARQRFPTITEAPKPAAVVHDDEFLDTLHEAKHALQYARDLNNPASPYMAAMTQRLASAETYAANLVMSRYRRNAVWFAVGVVVATITQFGMLWIGGWA